MKSRIIKGIVAVLLFTISAACMIYPYIANYVFEHRAAGIVGTVEQTIKGVEDKDKADALTAAQAYNDIISSGHVKLTDPFLQEDSKEDEYEYDKLLNLTDDGVMGIVEVPSIDITIPIYHGTTEQVLEKGVGHLQGTSLPIGGESVHTVLTGHSGLSNAKLFTDLTELVDGDVFFLNVLGEKLAYKVDQIKVVLPSEISDLTVIPGEDHCTLLTCTPYGVNTHRLLVRGVRTDYQEAISDPDKLKTKAVPSEWMREYKKALIISFVCLGIGLMTLFVIRHVRSRKNRSHVIDKFC